MLQIFRALKSEFGQTWTKHVYYRHAFLDYCKILSREISSNDDNIINQSEEQEKQVTLNRPPGLTLDQYGKKKKGAVYNKPVVEKIKQSLTRKKGRTRSFTEEELVEEEKFGAFLTKQAEKDLFGNLDPKEDADEPLVIKDYEIDEDRDKWKRNRLPAGGSNKFGTLAAKYDNSPDDTVFDPGSKYMKEIKADDEELSKIYNHVPLGNVNRKNEPNFYSRRIMKLGKQGHIAEAIAVFEDWMIKSDRVKPTGFEYCVLISELGKVGHIKKAFQIFNEMVRKGYEVHPSIYTALFNACSNCFNVDEGLKRAQKLRQHMLVKEIRPEYVTYQVMIKAFSRCGDVKTAFEIGDEVAHIYRPQNNLLNSLLYACISDREAGFRHAIMVWRKCLNMGINVNLTSYNLLLKCAKDCHVGDQKLLKQLLSVGDKAPLDYKALTSVDPVNVTGVKLIDSSQGENAGIYADDGIKGMSGTQQESNEGILSELGNDDGQTPLTDVYQQQKDSTDILPSVLDPDADFSHVLSIGKVESVKDRLALMGGLRGLLTQFQFEGVKPDVKTFTLLMSLVPLGELEVVLDEMMKARVRPDTGICNKYMERLNQHEKSVEEVLEVMKELKIRPDDRTYEQMAYACKTLDQARAFLTTLEAANMMPNQRLMTNLVKASHLNFSYKRFVLEKMSRLGIKPDVRCLMAVEKAISKSQEIAVKKKSEDELFLKSFDRFLTFYENWTKNTDIERREPPWKSFPSKKGE